GRALTNALIVYAHRERYERARNTFLGGPSTSWVPARLEAHRAPQPPSLLLQVEPVPDDADAVPEDPSLPSPRGESSKAVTHNPSPTESPRAESPERALSSPASPANAAAAAFAGEAGEERARSG